MRLISWNVNGLRACINKGFMDFYNKIDADIFCVQETKMQESQIDDEIKKINEYQFWNSAEKKGYSGTSVFSKVKPIKCFYDLDSNLIKLNKNMDTLNTLKSNNEGRIITLEYEKFFLINCYVPNSKRELERLDYRMQWEDDIRKLLKNLDEIKPIIYCGDFNVAHEEIDLKNPLTNHHSAGFTDNERDKFSKLLSENNFIDSYRYLYPNKKDEYSWWSYMFHAREKNVGWRIDYFIISDRLKDKIIDCKMHQEIYGSDHCPIELDIDI